MFLEIFRVLRLICPRLLHFPLLKGRLRDIRRQTCLLNSNRKYIKFTLTGYFIVNASSKKFSEQYSG